MKHLRKGFNSETDQKNWREGAHDLHNTSAKIKGLSNRIKPVHKDWQNTCTLWLC